MKGFAAAFDVVPGWLYALAVTALLVLLVSARLSASSAQVEAATAGKSLSDLVATSSGVAASSVQRARSKEQDMATDQSKDIHELKQATSDPAARIADLERRMRDQAAAHARAGGGCVRAAAGPASGGDAEGGAGLRGVVEPDPLVLDGQAQSELAQLLVSARITGETLKTGRKALERCASAND